MAWLLLLGAALLEVVWATALERSEGFTRLWPALVGITAAVVSFVMLTMAVRHLPLGTAYAVWVGLGAVGVVLVGIVVLGESASPLRLACLALIVVGVVGLKIV
ncbi:quaternary ammonium compound-resistance protein SugE [Saccharothrix tamanrassetensis]|uniref:Quaternary ammonium compound-resistance protein SugE n=1 Tax=Saccharothrix tamanrassetensis TaxID=1051531 RepID=A0A841CBI8_9PSEU|nr:SMR family transporter [Saccharothrix tamanrassetensis]MBB5954581.1 quaternary ammonium compound-resistance protein SugE [Saccharothrix tamanrassetensis]